MYEIYLEHTAEKDIRKLDPDLFARIIDRIKALSKNPYPHGCRKITGSASDWRIRVGDYRVIYEVVEKSRSITVMRVKHRSSVYR